MKVLLLAGGYATRLWPLTESLPKPLLVVGDKPLLSHVVDALPKDVEIVVSTNEDFAENFKDWHKEYHSDRKLEVFIEPSSRDKQLGALGAISYAIKQFGEDEYLISAGDNIYPFAIADFIKAYKQEILVAAYDIKSLEKAKKFGVITLDEKTKRAAAFHEKPKEPTSTLVSTALYIIPKKRLSVLHDAAKESSENIGSFLERAIAEKIPVDVFQFTGKWFDIGSFDTYIEVHQTFSQSAKADAKSKMLGSVYIAKDAVVENATVKDSIILNGSTVRNCSLDRVIVGRNCHLENVDLSYKSIRDNTRLLGA